VTPLEIQQLLEEAITTPVRDRPQIHLEEVDGDEVVVRITATPENPADGSRLARRCWMRSRATIAPAPPECARSALDHVLERRLDMPCRARPRGTPATALQW
jgi:hypothetical protein